MTRGFMVVLAFVATVAQAQQATTVAAGTRAVLPERKPHAIIEASRSPDSRTGPPAQSIGSSDRPTDCSVVETLAGDDVPAVRTYAAPPPARTGRNDWTVPFVKAVARCGSLYVLQILGQSKDPFVAQQARVEGPNGEVLHINALRFSKMKKTYWGINVIVAEAPLGVTVPNLKIYLTGEDGRVAQLKARDLP